MQIFSASSNVSSLSIREPTHEAFEVAVDLGHVQDIHHAEIRRGDARAMRLAARARPAGGALWRET